MRMRSPALPDPPWDRVEQRVLAAWTALRHPALRGGRARLARGAQILIGPAADVSLGDGFVARRDLTLTVNGVLRVGRNLFVNRGVMIAAMHQVWIGDDVRLGERVSIIDHNHVTEPLSDMAGRFADYEAAPVVIGDRVLISANCVVLAGARIGDDAVIAAGSVVRGEIPAGVLAAGAPATVKRPLRP
jgi:acetyltransferase-like isoleucine patch superfamily enzyme